MRALKLASIVLCLASLGKGDIALDQVPFGTNNSSESNSTSMSEGLNVISSSSCKHDIASNSSSNMSNRFLLSTINNETCELSLKAPGHQIRLFFRKLQILVSPGCFTSRVNIYQKSDEQWNLYDRYCGFHEPFHIITNSPDVLIKFEINQLDTNFANVLDIEYSSLNRSFITMRTRRGPIETSGTNGHLIIAPHNAFYRFGHTYVYSWRILATFDTLIRLHWSTKTSNNEFYLEISDGPTRNMHLPLMCQGTDENILFSILSKCSNMSRAQHHGDVLSSTNSIFILFSNKAGRNDTFNLNYTTIDMSEMSNNQPTCDKMTIELNNQPYILRKSILPASQCIMTFKTERSQGIFFEVFEISFDGYHHGRCEHSGVLLLDGNHTIGPFCSSTARSTDGYLPFLSTYVSSTSQVDLVMYCKSGCINLYVAVVVHKTDCRTSRNYNFPGPLVPTVERPCISYDFTISNLGFSHTFETPFKFAPDIDTTLSSCTLTSSFTLLSPSSPICGSSPMIRFVINATCLWSPAIISFKRVDLTLVQCAVHRRPGNYQNRCGVYLTPQLQEHLTENTPWKFVQFGLGAVNTDGRRDCNGQPVDQRCHRELSTPFYFTIELIGLGKNGCGFIMFNVTETVRSPSVKWTCHAPSVPSIPVISTVKTLSVCESSRRAPPSFIGRETDANTFINGRIVTMAAHDVIVRFGYHPFSVPIAMISYQKHIRNQTGKSLDENCPEGFVLLDEFCYFLNGDAHFTTELSWTDAQRHCEARNATLLSIATEKDANDVRDLIASRFLRSLYLAERTVIMIGLENFNQVWIP